MLYVPGAVERMLRKAASEVQADSIVMDCEDGVAESMKGAARETIALVLDDQECSGGGEAAVRINPRGSPHAEEDLAAVLGGARRLPNAVVLPKAEGPDDVRWLADRVGGLLARHPPRPSWGEEGRLQRGGGEQARRRPLALVTMCESAMALLNLRQTFEAALALPPAGARGAPPLQLQACILGGDDLAASLGATRSADNSELAWARGAFVLTCRAFGVQAIDIVKIDLSDAGMRQLAAEARAAALAGFSGKQVIHPKQVRPVQAAFSPSTADVQRALELLRAFQSHQAAGAGAFVHEGRMIDAPTVLQARNVLALAERLDAAGADTNA